MKNYTLILAIYLSVIGDIYADGYCCDDPTMQVQIHSRCCNEANVLVKEELKSLKTLRNQIQADLIKLKDNSTLKDHSIELFVERNKTLYESASISLESLRWLVGLLLGIVTLILASGTIFIIKENSNISSRVKLLDKEIDYEIKNSLADLKGKISTIERDAKNDVRLMMHATLLKINLSSGEIDENDIYSHLKELVFSKNEEFYPTIKRVLDANINEELNTLANKALQAK